MTYRVGTHHGVTINRDSDGFICGRPGHDCTRGHLVAVVVNGDRELAERICAALNASEQPRLLSITGPISDAELETIRARFLSNPGEARTLTVLPDTPDVDHTNGAREALAEVRRRLDARAELGPITRDALALVMAEAAAELGVDEEAPSGPSSLPESDLQGSVVGASTPGVPSGPQARCRKYNWPLTPCQGCGEPAQYGERWCAPCQPEGGWTGEPERKADQA